MCFFHIQDEIVGLIIVRVLSSAPGVQDKAACSMLLFVKSVFVERSRIEHSAISLAMDDAVIVVLASVVVLPSYSLKYQLFLLCHFLEN